MRFDCINIRSFAETYVKDLFILLLFLTEK